MNLLYFIILVTILFLVILPLFYINLFITKSKKKQVTQFIKHNADVSAYSLNSKNRMGDAFMFAPHTFTNWSLNPTYKNKYGELVHTIEGFRKTNPHDSILKLIEENKDSYNIVCIGGSTTHCDDMDKYEDTWPAKLQEELKDRKVVVFNFAVGAWGTLQSLIRCTTWLPIIKPQLLIFYQAKNDLTPIVNLTLDEKKIYPDYQNVYGQFGENLITKYPKWFRFIPLYYLLFYYFIYLKRIRQYGLNIIYKSWPKPAKFNPAGIKRLTEGLIENILFRHEMILVMCNKINSKVLYIPEIVNEVGKPVDIYSKTLKNKIFPRIYEMLKKYKHVMWYDMKDNIPNNNKYFIDKMHFTKEGNELFAKKISEIIKKNFIDT
tara:strand:+ start:774 stop:1904 length:1131 start_codon:yes stop_codon:yes gene_type:complete